MKMTIKMILPALLLAFASVAYAEDISLYSSGGTSNFTNGTLQYLGTGPLAYNGSGGLAAPTTPATASASPDSYDVASAGVWTAAIAGTSWVSNSPNSGPGGSVTDPNDFYYYQTTFTAVGGATPYDGSINVMSDDTAEILLNGSVIVPFGKIGGDGHCADGVPNCTVIDTVPLDGILLNAGTNTLEIINAQTGLSAAGVDMSADLTQTPEPASLLLLGSGLLGLAFILFRKNRAACLSTSTSQSRSASQMTLSPIPGGNMKLRVFAAMAALVLCASYANAAAIPYPNVGTPITTNTDLYATQSSPLVLAYYWSASAADTDYLEVYDVTTGKFLSMASNDSQTLANIRFFDNQPNPGSQPAGTSITLYGATAGDKLQLDLVNTSTGLTLTSDPANDPSDPGISHAYDTMFTGTIPDSTVAITNGVYIGMEDLSKAEGSDFDYNDDQYVMTGVSTTPEPGTLLLLGTGLLGLAFIAFRKSRSSHIAGVAGVLVAFLCLTGTARADSTSGAFYYQDLGPYTTLGLYSAPTSVPAGSPTVTFTANSTSGDVFSFDLPNPGVAGDVNLSKFLTYGGDTISGLSSAAGGLNINNGVFVFTGYTDLTAGKTYEFTHDDGMMLYLTGNGLTNYVAIDSPGATAADTSYFSVPDTGTYSYEVIYAEVNGGPAVLNSDISSSETPEPSSLLLLGTGLLGLAVILFRKNKPSDLIFHT
jgi:hypothetical protein